MDKEEAWEEATKLWNKLSLDSIDVGTYGSSYIIRVYYIPFKKNPNRHFRMLETKEEVKDFIKEMKSFIGFIKKFYKDPLKD